LVDVKVGLRLLIDGVVVVVVIVVVVRLEDVDGKRLSGGNLGKDGDKL
jgi:hypothetical protein